MSHDSFSSAEMVRLSVPVRSPLAMLVKPSHDHVSSRVIKEHGVWEPHNTALVEALLREGDHFIDLGANLGYFSLLAGQYVTETGRVWAFEPEPESYRFCEENILINQLPGIISLHRLAIGDVEETQVLYRAGHNHGAHQLTHPCGDGFDAEGLGVEVTTLDLFAESQPEARCINLIKMDVQGYEMKAFLGMSELIARNRERLMALVEFSPVLLSRFDQEGKGLARFLQFIEREVHAVYVVESTSQAIAENVAIAPLSMADLRRIASDMLRMDEGLPGGLEHHIDLLLVFSTHGLARLERRAEALRDP